MSTITFMHPQYAVCRAKTEFCNDDKVDHSKSVVIDLEYVTNLHIVVITVYCTTKQWYSFEWGLHLWWWWNHHSSCYKWKVWRSFEQIFIIDWSVYSHHLWWFVRWKETGDWPEMHRTYKSTKEADWSKVSLSWLWQRNTRKEHRGSWMWLCYKAGLGVCWRTQVSIG